MKSSARGVLRQLGSQLFGSSPGSRDWLSRPACSRLFNPPAETAVDSKPFRVKFLSVSHFVTSPKFPHQKRTKIWDTSFVDQSGVHLEFCLQLCHCCSVVPAPQLRPRVTTYSPWVAAAALLTIPPSPPTGNLLESLKLS